MLSIALTDESPAIRSTRTTLQDIFITTTCSPQWPEVLEDLIEALDVFLRCRVTEPQASLMDPIPAVRLKPQCDTCGSSTRRQNHI